MHYICTAILLRYDTNEPKKYLMNVNLLSFFESKDLVKNGFHMNFPRSYGPLNLQERTNASGNTYRGRGNFNLFKCLQGVLLFFGKILATTCIVDTTLQYQNKVLQNRFIEYLHVSNKDGRTCSNSFSTKQDL